MNRPFDLIVFDWDGTLMDSARKIVRCFQAAAADLGLPVPTEDRVRHIIGLGLNEALAELLPETDADTRQRVAERYREHFLFLDETEMPLFPGVREGLEGLAAAGFRMAIATGKARRGLDRVLRDTRTSVYFCSTRCADEAGSKPHPRMLYDILAHTGVMPERAVMVGDTTYDLEMAKAASLSSIAVSYGAHDRARLLNHDPLACLDTFSEVCAWLRPPRRT
ncbi:HAD family hydrolase [Sulfurifustis variabilis]|uniref:HAD family hydrolase n=1 Tax=Sulfurifustis variabilis TaxID=1675686 RepID=A0A1B4V4H7_9GAMM|nr:HAD-IA family hydrolase [Sulfurifustis variabilis]BAU48443.1 HAD family hydrolase [Sulfurifustis variabilis]